VLFLTGYLADEFFADGSGGEVYFGAKQVVVLSASSKTAIGFAQRAAKRAGLVVVGVTSAANADFVRSLGFHDSVITYDDIDELDLLDSVVVDMAGNPNVLASVHHRLGDRVRHSMMIGRSHHDAVPSPDAPNFTGPAPQFFFVPADIERRLALWGPEEYRRRTAAATEEFVAGSRSWMTIDRRSGPGGVSSAWGDAISGNLAPNVSRWQLNLGGEYDVPSAPGLTLTARMISTSSQYLDAANSRSVPGWTRWDVGARYATKAWDRPLVLRAGIENLLGRDYWASGSGSWLYLGRPRTLMVSATVDF
jgi:hypothetical protein